MRYTLLLFAAIAAALIASRTAGALTSYPNAACPDSVTIHQVLAAGPCQPAGSITIGDTVRSVGGIITAVDAIPSAFDFFIQNNAAAAGVYSGMEVFTGQRDYTAAPFGFARGDSVVVEWAGVQIFQFNTRLASPNNNSTAPNIIVRKVSAGGAIPAPVVLTTTQLANPESNSASAPWLGSLVQVNGPLTVARVNPQGTYTFFLVSPVAPRDSVLVNGFAFTNYASPPLGAPVDLVRGVWSHSTGRHYELKLRDADDIRIATPTTVRPTSWGRLKSIYR